MSMIIIPAYKPDKTLASIVDQLWVCGCGMIIVDDGSGEEYQSIFEQVSDVAIVCISYGTESTDCSGIFGVGSICSAYQ